MNPKQFYSLSDSCFRRSSRLDVATVQLVNSTDNECALSAEISAVSKSSLRKTSIVIVENKGLWPTFVEAKSCHSLTHTQTLTYFSEDTEV